LNQDAACFYDNHAVVSDDGGAVTVFTNQGGGVVNAFADNRAVLHKNHGILTASRHSVDDAVFWFIAMDRCCHVQLLLEASGTKPDLMDDSAARHSATHVGSDYLGWLHFQPVYDQVLAANPDMFD
jgi:ribulose-5-phosphate 4-epimerase/fuculose-1-phosphate aldolase